MSEQRRTRSAEELWKLDWEGDDPNHTIEVVEEEIDDSWRHGNYYSVVVKETTPDGTVAFWKGFYQASGDGEYNSWREGECGDFTEVFPKLVTIQKVIYE